MKNWMGIPLAAMIGLIAGSWGPRQDLRLLRERMQEERTLRTASAASGFDAFAKLTGIPDVAKKGSAPQPPQTVADETNAVAKAEEPERLSGRERVRRQMDRKDLRARIDEAVDLWRTRVELATVQWKERLGVSRGKSEEEFDAAIVGMNEALLEMMQTVADEIEAAGKMTPELALRLMGDASRVMAETYDALGAMVPEDRRADISELPIFEFIDPSVADPLVGVQDKLEGSFPERTQ